jgi:molybdopterin converting factor small subunit
VKVIAHLGEPFWRAANTHEVSLMLRDDATVSDACDQLARLYPALDADLNHGETQPAIFVNDDQADRATPLIEGAQLYLLWPVSGG